MPQQSATGLIRCSWTQRITCLYLETTFDRQRAQASHRHHRHTLIAPIATGASPRIEFGEKRHAARHQHAMQCLQPGFRFRQHGDDVHGQHQIDAERRHRRKCLHFAISCVPSPAIAPQPRGDRHQEWRRVLDCLLGRQHMTGPVARAAHQQWHQQPEFICQHVSPRHGVEPRQCVFRLTG